MANSYLTHTQSAGNRRTWTFSAWIKFSNVSDVQRIFLAHNNTHPSTQIDYNGSKIAVYNYDGSNTNFIVQTNRLFRDVNGWYHLVVAVDTTQATASDRVKLYINGVQETSLAQSSYPSQNFDTEVNDNSAIAQVSGGGTPGNSFNGYMSHVALVDGQALAPTVFGETDSTSGIWKFKTPTGVTWGTNGFHLKFENSGALGTDSSGNTNTFTVNGNLKQAVDTPSNVYCTLNTLNKQISGAALSNGNNTLTTTSGSPYTGTTGSTMAFSKGKWYFEAQCTTSPNSTYPIFGFGDVTQVVSGNNQYMGDPSNFTNISVSTGRGTSNVYKTGSSTSTYSASDFPFSTNDVLMVAIDYDNDKIWWGKNGTWLASGDPANGNNPSQTGFISTITPNDNFITPYFGDENYSSSATINVNFGNGFFGTTAITSAGSNGNGSLFEYDVPSGYYALNTKNINTYG